MDDNGGEVIGIFIVLAIIIFVVYIVVLVAAVIAAIAAAGGTLWGGGTAVGNYFASFKENMIDSNKSSYAA